MKHIGRAVITFLTVILITVATTHKNTVLFNVLGFPVTGEGLGFAGILIIAGLGIVLGYRLAMIKPPSLDEIPPNG